MKKQLLVGTLLAALSFSGAAFAEQNIHWKSLTSSSAFTEAMAATSNNVSPVKIEVSQNARGDYIFTQNGQIISSNGIDIEEGISTIIIFIDDAVGSQHPLQINLVDAGSKEISLGKLGVGGVKAGEIRGFTPGIYYITCANHSTMKFKLNVKPKA